MTATKLGLCNSVMLYAELEPKGGRQIISYDSCLDPASSLHRGPVWAPKTINHSQVSQNVFSG